MSASPRTRCRLWRRLLSMAASVFGGILVAWLGWSMASASLAAGGDAPRKRPPLGWIFGSLSESIARLSYDLLFVLRGSRSAQGACLVYIDEGASRALETPLDPWDRALHAKLVRRLTQLGARAIFFDIV